MAGQRNNQYEITHIFCSGKEEGNREFAVAFVVQWNMKRNVLDCKADEQQIYELGIKTIFQNVSLLNLHAPTEEKGLEKDAFSQKVEEMYDSCLSIDIKTVRWDWNAKV